MLLVAAVDRVEELEVVEVEELVLLEKMVQMVGVREDEPIPRDNYLYKGIFQGVIGYHRVQEIVGVEFLDVLLDNIGPIEDTLLVKIWDMVSLLQIMPTKEQK